MFTKAFWRDAAERTITTFAEALIAFLATVQFGILEVDWTSGLSVAGLAALIALLKALAANKTNKETGASLFRAATPTGLLAAKPEDRSPTGQVAGEASIYDTDGKDVPVDVEPVPLPLEQEDKE